MAPPDDSDRMLVTRALSGDAAAWEALVDRYGGLVYATVRKAGVPRRDAEDVAQEVFRHLLRSLGSVREIERLPGWIVQVARRESWRANRAAARPDRRQPSGTQDPASGPREDDHDRFERDCMVRAALGAIDERCQSLLRVLFLSGEEAGYASAARQFGITENSVGPIRNRCLKRLLAAPGWHTALVVAHEGTNRLLLSWMTGAGLRAVQSFEQDLACINVLDFDMVPREDGSVGTEIERRFIKSVNLTPYNYTKHGMNMTALEAIFARS